MLPHWHASLGDNLHAIRRKLFIGSVLFSCSHLLLLPSFPLSPYSCFSLFLFSSFSSFSFLHFLQQCTAEQRMALHSTALRCTARHGQQCSTRQHAMSEQRTECTAQQRKIQQLKTHQCTAQKRTSQSRGDGQASKSIKAKRKTKTTRSALSALPNVRDTACTESVHGPLRVKRHQRAYLWTDVHAVCRMVQRPRAIVRGVEGRCARFVVSIIRWWRATSFDRCWRELFICMSLGSSTRT